MRGGWSLLPRNQQQDQRQRPQVVSGEVQIGYQQKLLYGKSGQALEQAAQGGSGLPIPGGVQKTCGCGTSGYGLLGMVVLGGRLDSMILGLFQPMIL